MYVDQNASVLYKCKWDRVVHAENKDALRSSIKYIWRFDELQCNLCKIFISQSVQGVSTITCRYDWTLLSFKNSRRQDISVNKVELQWWAWLLANRHLGSLVLEQVKQVVWISQSHTQQTLCTFCQNTVRVDWKHLSIRRKARLQSFFWFKMLFCCFALAPTDS